MNKKRWSFYSIVVLAVLAFFTVSLGGCGGSSHDSLPIANNNNNNSNEPVNPAPTRHVWNPDTAINLATATAGFDFNGNGRMDFLDFGGVGQFHLGENTAASGLPFRSSFRAASEVEISVPAMIWLEELRPKNENPNIFQVYLESDKEYTFEFSKNLTDGINAQFPDLQIFDPENAALPFDEASPLRPEITPYPPESPSLICYTLKPAVTGYYLVKVSSQKSTMEVYAEAENIEASDVEPIDTGCVIFVYQENRNGDEPGYYTRYRFSDINGNETDPISIQDIIQLRKLFLEANPDYLETVYGQNADDDEFGDGDNASYNFNNASSDAYLDYMDKVQDELGLVDADSVNDFDTSVSAAFIRLAELPEISEDNDGEDDPLDSADIALKDYYDDYYKNKSDSDTFGAPRRHSTKKVLSGVDDVFGGTAIQRSTIPANISGIPYEPTYRLGAGYSAITNLSSKGGMTAIGLEEAIEEMYSSTSDRRIPMTTNFWTELITTREEAEKHSEVTAGGSVSLAKNAAGSTTFSVGSSSNYKYGLTSMTLVIHFEAAETDYRLLTAQGYNELMLDNKLHKKAKKLKPDVFRDNYGDYFVAGYQYGACYEANISIVTETMEQLESLKTDLQASGTYNGVTASLDVAAQMSEAFRKSSARINISVITTGLGAEVPTELPIAQSTDIDGMQQVFAEYANFRAQIMSNIEANNRASFVPIRVFLMRWRSFPAIADQVLDRWSDQEGADGTIPITPDQFGEAQAMNAALVNLRAYYNASEPARATIAAEDNNRIATTFNGLVGTLTAKGEDFYTTGTSTGDKLSEYLPKITELATECKGLTDRYIFYRKLIAAQKQERAVIDALDSKLSAWKGDDSGDSDRLKVVNQCPFGSSGGGNSGFRSFPVSSIVTGDFYACEENPKQVFDSKVNKEWGCHMRRYVDTRDGGTSRLEWWYGQREDSDGSEDWQEDVGDAYLKATAKDGSRAVFTFVSVSSTATNSADDRRRFLDTSSRHAVGARDVGFRFMTGYGDAASWTIQGTAIRLRETDYPFSGLED